MPLEARLRDEIVGIVAEIAEVAPAAVAPDASLESLGIDSLGGLRIVAAVERRYGIVIDEAAVGRIRSMTDIFAIVERYRSTGTA